MTKLKEKNNLAQTYDYFGVFDDHANELCPELFPDENDALAYIRECAESMAPVGRAGLDDELEYVCMQVIGIDVIKTVRAVAAGVKLIIKEGDC